MLETLREQVWQLHMELPKNNLVTWSLIPWSTFNCPLYVPSTDIPESLSNEVLLLSASVSSVHPGTSTPDWNTFEKFSTMSSVVGLVSVRYGTVPPYTSRFILYCESSKSVTVEN